MRPFVRICGSALFVVFILGLVACALYFNYLMLPPDASSEETVVVEIPRGATTRDIAVILHEKGLIKHPDLFRIIVSVKGLGQSLKAGEYLLTKNMYASEIAERLVEGRVITYPLTVPEGLTLPEIARIVADQGWADYDTFLRLVDESQLNREFLPEGVELIRPMEGYLAPNTYRFARGESELVIIRTMYERTLAIFDKERLDRAKELGMTVHEVLTLASIIEKEAVIDEERPTISAVYHNRLKIGMKLDADPTVLYSLGRTGGLLTFQDLEVTSPYNTYRHGGLPPGPIAAPGEKSIDAALYPADVPYLYFVSKNDGSHAFARTYREHLQNVQKYQSGG